ncbi:MAG: OmpA family protein [Pontixanthobacter sp.]
MRKLVIGLAMASTALASPALARDGQWYVELGGGPMIVEDLDFDLDGDSDSVEVETDDYGFDAGGLVGYDFGAFRLEAEASFREVDVEGVSVGPRGVSSGVGLTTFGDDIDAAGDVNALSFMVNGLFDFGPDDGLQAFAGGGVGVARTEVQTSINSLGSGVVDDSDTGFAWQILAGVRAPLTDTVDVGLRYRMFNAENVDLIETRGLDFDGDMRTHSLMGTLTFNFGGEPEPVIVAPVPAPVPAPRPPVVAPTPAPAPVCNQGPYVVFFEWDESDITPEAATILDNAVSAYANCGMASVMLAGHTDTSGPAAYNVGLSERRNDSVNNYLTGRGVPSARISSEAFGESQLRVPTANGVRELQNRRVQIMYGPGSGM